MHFRLGQPGEEYRAEEVALVSRQEARLAAERAQSQADSLRAERARQDAEAERMRIAQADSLAARLLAEREGAERLAREGQQERDGQRELERLRQEQQAQQRGEVERLRQLADSLEAPRSAEAQARAAAEAVRAALIAERIDPSRIDMAGYGQSQPVADNATADGRGRNRRVEIVIVGARRPKVVAHPFSR